MANVGELEDYDFEKGVISNSHCFQLIVAVLRGSKLTVRDLPITTSTFLMSFNF